MNEIIITAIKLAVLIIAFLLGRYVLPYVKRTVNLDSLTFVANWAYSFVVEAKNLLVDSTGAEKKKAVTRKLKTICERYKINLSSEQISALIEDAYSAMKAGEKLENKG